MDCCNYVQPYHPGHGNFYQQQHFCYDNMTGYATNSTAYGTAPISDSIEVNARYARLQAAYPTDYVYNPKEARLRKAMREQCRELSRQSILQSTVTTTSGNTSATGANSTNGSVGERGVARSGAAGGGGGGGGGGSRSGSVGVEISGSSNFLSHPMSSCASPAPTAAVGGSSLPGSSSGYNSGRIINPWFSVGHTTPASHIKPMLSHRVMQAHQRTFDKTKEVLRKQPECAGAFSAASAAAASCYPGDFTVHGAPTQAVSDTSVGGLESNDYCSGGGIGEFSDAQKWHPYQSTAAYHARGPINKMTSRHAMQSINAHGHGPWNQFCGVPLFSMAAQNQMVRGPRHMVFLQDQQERHCGYPDEMPMNYMTNKIDSHRLQPSYTQNYQQETDKCIEDAPRWEPPSVEPAITNLVTSPREQDRERVREKHPPKKEEPNNKEYQENVEPQTKTPRKQPLPGFHQAFGSTEIGRFSRSEFFASMVNDNNISGAGSVGSSNGIGVGVGVVSGNNNGLIPDGYLPVSMFPFHPVSSNNLRTGVSIPRGHTAAKEIILPNDCYWIAQNVGYPVTNISDPNSNYVTFLEMPRMNRDWIHHPNAVQMPQNYTPLIERPPFVYQDPRIHPESSRQINQSPNKKSSGSDSSNSSVDSLTYSASDKLNSDNKKDPPIKEDTDENEDEEEEEEDDENDDDDDYIGEEEEEDDDDDDEDDGQEDDDRSINITS